MPFLLQCLITFFALQGVLEVAGNPMIHNIRGKALRHRLRFGRSIGRSVAECGADAAAPGASCPGNACCSTGKVIAGYWQGWNMGKACATMKPEEIPVDSLTHLIFSFGFVAPDTYKVLPMPDTEEGLFNEVTDVKKKNPNLKVLVALGGWTHTDPGPYREVFTTMVSSPANRQAFITNLLSFLTQYNFDGVDLDWEYPGAEDRGGRPTDKENFAKLLQEMRHVFQSKYVMTFAAPLASYYLQNYDLKVASEAVDWINVMAYDIHGTWESDKKAAGHTNLTDVNKGVENYLKAGVAPIKLVLGTAFYGRSVKMASGSCTQPGCTFTGPGAEGRCVKTAGYLSHTEINDVISGGAKPVFDQAGSVQHLTWGRDNWVSQLSSRLTMPAGKDYEGSWHGP
ncbi:glycoside hydrolase superfamily [Aspergillus pseudonomiae]|uniref:chitinase n=1 Tax=Aspergillus pseudonomiae TaxID=1506151 RepID=A0A5N7DU24_9EURO|nr:glycoside hydrolase superfamily [Aspergillus pseudonomiae]KAE8409977.1 glycoside hydrolase superfamily [Aspergillus pseudonomiae]